MNKIRHFKIKLLSICFLFICMFLCVFINPTSQVDTPLLKYTVVIDAGHGGIDGGVIGYSEKTCERDINLDFALKLGALFNGLDCTVVYTRENQNGLYDESAKNKKVDDMKKRIEIINKNNANLVISIHQNGYTLPDQRGIMAYYKTGQEASKNLAQVLQNRFIKNLPYARSEALAGDFFILNECNALCVLIECGFLTNPEEEKLLSSSDYQDKVCFEIFTGCVQYLVNEGEICINN